MEIQTEKTAQTKTTVKGLFLQTENLFDHFLFSFSSAITNSSNLGRTLISST